jgi:flagellar protein FliS
MLMCRSPSEAYAKVDFDARVAGAGPRELVLVCYERLIGEIDRACAAHAAADNAAKSQAITKALAALTALELGIDHDSPMATALLQLYRPARHALVEAVVAFDAVLLRRIRSDLDEIRLAFLAAR